MKARINAVVLSAALVWFGSGLAADSVPTDIQQPGTQPGEIGTLESPNKCDNCHGGYNSSVEPAHNWRGSMMAHAGRDPIFWATVAIAEQDFDGSGDLCIRCHSTGGWLAGRSTPTDGSGLAAGDSDGVECDFCHKLTNPDDTEHLGTMLAPFIANEPNLEDLFDWDPAVAGADGIEGYLGSGMASVWGGSDKLGPYNDADARHQFMESKFHRDRDFCGTCHDVSNPAVGDLAHNHGAQVPLEPGTFSGIPNVLDPEQDVWTKAAFNNPPYKYGVVERTFSEYKAGQISRTLLSPFGGLSEPSYTDLPPELQAGALKAIYEAATQNGDGHYQNPRAPRYFSCQSCHMRPVTGEGANKRGAPVRNDLPLHDMTGGNYWMPEAINYLNGQGKLRLGGGMTQTQIDAMLDGALRAKEQLELAATLKITGNPGNVRIVNHTGHKLISGYPEGRRMWLNVKWYDSAGQLIHEDGEYGDIAVTLPGRGPMTVRSLLDLGGTYTKIYEAHMGMTQQWADQLVGLGYDVGLVLAYDRYAGGGVVTLGELAGSTAGTEHETFHFVLNNTVISDNRIPPYGMDREAAGIRNALPVPADQYNGNSGTYDYFDEVPLHAPSGASSAVVNLMYQPTSWEYIQFLYLANKGSDPANGGNAFLGEEGNNMLEAWLNTGMAEPYVMASATWGAPPGECSAPIPVLLSASAADKQVSVSWQEIPTEDISNFKLYYDQAGKAQLVADLTCTGGSQEACTSYPDTGLTNGTEYCYKVTSVYEGCESGFSNILCAVPTQPGQEVAVGLVEPLRTGKWVKEGKGKGATTTFVSTDSFVRGDGVVIQATVQDETGTPVSGATVTIGINGPELAQLTSGPSDAGGVAEVTWNTQSPNKRGQGGTTTGSYTASVINLSASGLIWDRKPATTSFTINP